MAKKGVILILVLFVLFIKIVEAAKCKLDDVCEDGSFTHIYPYSNVCKPCFCSGECSTETFCPEFDTIDVSYEECQTQLRFFNIANGVWNEIPVHLKTSYFVVVRCPPDADKELKADCESRNSTEDKLYVSSVSTYRIYKNKYCAQCNGEDNYVKWGTAVVVNDEEMNALVSGAGTKIETENLPNLEQRISISIPPLGFPEDTNACSSNVITKCNVSGKWETFDKNIFELCKLPKFPLVSAISKRKSYNYRNFYCALCNGLSSATCPKYLNKGKNKWEVTNMLTLLYWNDDVLSSANGVEDKELTHTCNNNQIVDPLEVRFRKDVFVDIGARCINFTCPIGHIPLIGKCEKNIAGYSLYFHVTYKTSTLASTSIQGSASKWIHDQLNVTGCYHCQSQKQDFIVVDNYTFIVYESINLGFECDITKLASSLQDFEKRISSERAFNFSNGVMFNASFQMNYKQNVQYTPTLSITSTCPAHVKLWQKYHCSSIVMTSDILSKLERLGLSDEIYNMSEPFINPNNEIQVDASSRIICLSDYKRIIQKSGSNGIGHIHTYILCSICLCSYFFLKY